MRTYLWHVFHLDLDRTLVNVPFLQLGILAIADLQLQPLHRKKKTNITPFSRIRRHPPIRRNRVRIRPADPTTATAQLAHPPRSAHCYGNVRSSRRQAPAPAAGKLIPFVSFVMIEKPIAGPVHEPPSEHHLRCDAGPPAGRYERQHCGTAPLPQCAHICVTTAAGANDDTRESPERRPPDHPFSFQVVTVIDPEALNGAYPQPQQPAVVRGALRNLRGRRYADDALLRRNLLFRSTSSSLPRRRPHSWRKEAGGPRSARCKLRPHRVPAGPASPKAAPAAGPANLSDDLIREEITKLVLDDHFAPAAAENAVVGGDFEGAAQPAAEQPAPEDAAPAAQTRQPEPVIQLKKKKKKKKAKPEKKKFNLMKFKQKVPIEGTDYRMEVYLEKEVIDRTRKGKIDISKDPKVEVKYNKVADLRDEFSSYCSERKKLKNWLFYA